MSSTKNAALKYVAIGALVGPLDGLAFVLSFHSSFSFLTPLLFLLALPCFAVALRLDGGGRFPDWVPWTAGVLTVALIGAAVGLIFHWVRAGRQPLKRDPVRPTGRDESRPDSHGGF